METAQAPTTLCPHCGNPSRTTDYCGNCSRPINPRQSSVVVPPRLAGTLPGEELANLLMLLAYGILGTGLIFSIYVWAKYGTIASASLFGQGYSVSNPYAKIAAFLIAANSVIWAALLAGVSRAVRNTIELSQLVTKLSAR